MKKRKEKYNAGERLESIGKHGSYVYTTVLFFYVEGSSHGLTSPHREEAFNKRFALREK